MNLHKKRDKSWASSGSGRNYGLSVSYEHFLTFRDDPISLGGNGPDFEQMLDGINLVDQFTAFQSVEFLRGPLWGAKPHYTPNTGETFELIN